VHFFIKIKVSGSNSGVKFFLLYFLRAFQNGHSNAVQQKYRLLTVSLLAQKFFNFLLLPPFFVFPGFSLVFGAGHLPWIDHSNRTWNRLCKRLSISFISIAASSMKESIRFHR
jgi:hypothetical protein